MGAKLVTPTANNTMFLTCKTDADCNAANSNLTNAVTAATTATEKAQRCCLRVTATEIGTSSDAKTELDAAKLKGYPTEKGTYTKTCDYNYPVNLKVAGITQEHGRFVLAENGNKWNMYCDGASTLVVSAAAVITATAVSMY